MHFKKKSFCKHYKPTTIAIFGVYSYHDYNTNFNSRSDYTILQWQTHNVTQMLLLISAMGHAGSHRVEILRGPKLGLGHIQNIEMLMLIYNLPKQNFFSYLIRSLQER